MAETFQLEDKIAKLFLEILEQTKVVLLSSPAGLKLYSDLGFKADSELDFYI